MVALLQQGTSSSTTNPALSIWVLVGGALVDPSSIAFAVLDVSDATKIAAPVQTYPAVVDPAPAAPQAVDLVADKVGPGHFVAAFTLAGDEPAGRHRIRWTVVLEDGGSARTIEEDFDVVAGVVLFPGQQLYCSISDMRDEGVTSAACADARLQSLIAFASRRIEEITKRRFYAHAGTITVDGAFSKALRFGEPVIAVSLFEKLSGDDDDPQEIEASTYAVYNRHITQGLLTPDDRQDPRVAFKNDSRVAWVDGYERHATALRYRRSIFNGQQRYRVTGLWGYTDPDAQSFVGVTPTMIREACKLLVLQTVAKLTKPGNANAGGGVQGINSESTREQSVGFGPSLQDKIGQAGVGDMTGDAIVDQMLSFYAAPPLIGLV